MIRFFLIFILLGLCPAALAQGNLSFEPVQPSGLPYTIIIRDAGWNGNELPDGTLLAAFSDTLCVGAIEYTSGGNVQLIAWESDLSQNLAGFQSGDTIQIYALIDYQGNLYPSKADVIPIEGNGCFGWGTFGVVDLIIEDSSFISVTDSWIKLKQVLVYPNPFGDRIMIAAQDLSDVQIELIDCSGRIIQRMKTNVRFNPELDVSALSSGWYVVKLQDLASRITYQFKIQKIIQTE
jgi:hypothetical protein